MKPLPPVSTSAWPHIKLGYLVREMGGSTPSKERLGFWDGEIPWVSPKDMKRERISGSIDHVSTEALAETNLRFVPEDSVLMVVRGMILAHSVPVALTTAPVTVNQDMKALTPSPGLTGTFLRYSLRGHEDRLLALVEEAGHGTRCLQSELWRKFAIPVPPLPTQHAIADFLDRKTAAIDALIEKKQKLLDLLAEKRAALINQAVTKGLDPGVPMKDSGIPWIGEIPVGWEVKRLKNVVTHVVDCHHSTPEYDDDAIYPALRTADVRMGWLDIAGARRVHEDEYQRRISRLRPREGDIVYSREGERWGLAGPIPANSGACLAQRVMLFRTTQTTHCGFLMWALNSSAIYNQLAVGVVGATSPHVNIGDIRNVLLACPVLADQQAIAAHLGLATREAKVAEARLVRSLSLLHEYRQALITAAVTGQLDIPGEAA